MFDLQHGHLPPALPTHKGPEGQPVMTHGYVHGHVHQHKDHMHIHGHIHNHDHGREPPAQETDAEFLQLACPDLQNAFNLCTDVLCDDLDDCYFTGCDNSTLTAPHSETDMSPPPADCCDDPSCLLEPGKDICTDTLCIESGHHVNTLCADQRPKLDMFENLIQNLQRNIELYSMPAAPAPAVEEPPRKMARTEDSNLRIHFPHHCHQEDNNNWQTSAAAEVHHDTHQSCFHVKLPAGDSTEHVQESVPPQSDYDFFMQFNNFNRIIGQPASPPHPSNHTSNHPSSYSCKWENCFQPLDDSTFMDHLLGTHVKNEVKNEVKSEPQNEYSAHFNQPTSGPYECEWELCHRQEDTLEALMEHLESHKGTSVPQPSIVPVLADYMSKPDFKELVDLKGLPTPAELTPEDKKDYSLNITNVTILPKASLATSFRCKWQVGSDAAGEPILCNKPHANEGDLQSHLINDHVGGGQSMYHCCWYGCVRNKGKPFPQRQKLLRHIHTHTGHKPCLCRVCGALFAVPSLLKQHERIHLGERPYECKECGKKFTCSSSLAIHKRVHMNLRPMKCTWPGCGKSFRDSSNLSKHMRTHHAQKLAHDEAAV